MYRAIIEPDHERLNRFKTAAEIRQANEERKARFAALRGPKETAAPVVVRAVVGAKLPVKKATDSDIVAFLNGWPVYRHPHGPVQVVRPKVVISVAKSFTLMCQVREQVALQFDVNKDRLLDPFGPFVIRRLRANKRNSIMAMTEATAIPSNVDQRLQMSLNNVSALIDTVTMIAVKLDPNLVPPPASTPSNPAPANTSVMDKLNQLESWIILVNSRVNDISKTIGA